jgi:hypothetical protein
VSSETNIYVGPFAKCKIEQLPGSYKRPACPNEACKDHRKTVPSLNKFCKSCGTRIELVKFQTTVDSVDMGEDDEIYYELEELDLDSPTFQSNHDVPDKDKQHIWYSKSGELKIGDISDPDIIAHLKGETTAQYYDISNELDEFTKSKGFQRLRELYGADNLEVHWGVLSWIS